MAKFLQDVPACRQLHTVPRGRGPCRSAASDPCVYKGAVAAQGPPSSPRLASGKLASELPGASKNQRCCQWGMFNYLWTQAITSLSFRSPEDVAQKHTNSSPDALVTSQGCSEFVFCLKLRPESMLATHWDVPS